MTPVEWFLVGIAAVVVLMLFPVAILLTAKLWAYGSARGRHNFDQEQNRKGKNGTA